jgi:HlyD family secretion protein
MKKAILSLIVLAVIGGGVYGYFFYGTANVAPNVMTATVTRGDIAQTVGSTGTLQAVTTVQVGTQVSGIVQELYADFNSLVRKGQVIARLDPSTIETQIQQAEANLVRVRADLERGQVSLEDSRNKLRRAEELFARNLIPATELEAAQVAVRSAEASLKSSEASVGQNEASLNQQRVNLGYTVITAPIDGLVISRNVDRGQTVASSQNAPTLFILAADLSKLQLLSNIDESDVGRIRPGQTVRFRVDAYPADEFIGVVSQVRLNPIVQQGVVSYATVIDVNNPDLRLRPGMTANVNVEIARRTDVLRVPNAALRYRPTNEIFTALGQPVPGAAPAPGGAPAPARPGATTDGPTAGAAPAAEANRGSAPAPAAGQAAEGGGRGRGGNFQNLSPEEREQMLQAMGGRGGRGGGRGGQNEAPQAAASAAQASRGSATTIDALFGPLPTAESRGQVWIYDAEKHIESVRVRLGVSDGQLTELLDGGLQEGQEIVTNILVGGTRQTPTAGNNNQFNPFGGQGGRGPGGIPGGGGGGRGGGGRGF